MESGVLAVAHQRWDAHVVKFDTCEMQSDAAFFAATASEVKIN